MKQSLEALRAKIQLLESQDAQRRAKAIAATKAWKLKHPDRVNRPRTERRNLLKNLHTELKLKEEALDTGDLTVYDPSVDQLL